MTSATRGTDPTDIARRATASAWPDLTSYPRGTTPLTSGAAHGREQQPVLRTESATTAAQVNSLVAVTGPGADGQ